MSLTRREIRQYILVSALVLAFFALTPAADAAPVDNPYVGSWVTDDLPIGTELRLQVGNTGRFHTWDEEVLGGPCQFGLVTHQGQGEFIGSSFVVTAPFKRLCHPADGSDAFALPQVPDGLTITYDHDAATDTLELTVALDGEPLEQGTCYDRRGTDACNP